MWLQLQFNIGPAPGLPANVLAFGISLEYRRNMFGKDADREPGAKQSTAIMSLTRNWPPKGSRD